MNVPMQMKFSEATKERVACKGDDCEILPDDIDSDMCSYRRIDKWFEGMEPAQAPVEAPVDQRSFSVGGKIYRYDEELKEAHLHGRSKYVPYYVP